MEEQEQKYTPEELKERKKMFKELTRTNPKNIELAERRKEKISDFIDDNKVPLIFTFFILIVSIVTSETLWAIIFAPIMFSILYLRQNAFNSTANRWVRIGGIIVVMIWLLSKLLK
ncbi:MAG: hypothetical protein Q7T34_00485 [Candidatus Parcubacteria bacterium]|nr:hypothetical protein [Candidatus Parcubacteria bacterium]